MIKYLLILSFLLSTSLSAQHQVLKHINELKAHGKLLELPIQPFTQNGKRDNLKDKIKDHKVFKADKEKLKKIVHDKSETLRLELDGKTLNLYRDDDLNINFVYSNGKEHEKKDISFYRGVIEGDDNSLVSISLTEDGADGFLSDPSGNTTFTEDSGEQLLFLDASVDSFPVFQCAEQDTIIDGIYHPALALTIGGPVMTKCVNFYWEIGNDVYLTYGSGTALHMAGIANQSKTLYLNDGINWNLKTMYIWTTPDPYTLDLNSFMNYRTSYDGDMALLIKFGGRGVAWVYGYCTYPPYAEGVAGISSTYNLVPIYSWTVEVITHETGHLLGSQHTHDCLWNGNYTKIDSCGDYRGYTSGNCALPPYTLPAGGGTIMSYCQLTPAGINFSKGFGQQPRDRIVESANAQSCLTSCVTCPVPSQPGVINGNTAVCQGSQQTYSISPISGATSYTWSVPSGWTYSQIGTSIICITGGSGQISVSAVNGCGPGIASSIAVSSTTNQLNSPDSITGPTGICQGTPTTYSVNPVPGAVGYNWSLPMGWSGSSSTTSISVIPGSNSGAIICWARNSCTMSTSVIKSVSINPLPSSPGVITGLDTICKGKKTAYSIPLIGNAISYQWTIPSGFSGSSLTNSITLTTGSTSGTLTVKGKNSCGVGPASTKYIMVATVPSQPSTISGDNKICRNTSGIYGVTKDPKVSSYKWTFRGISQTETSNVILMNFTDLGGTLTVLGADSCGNGSTRALGISIIPNLSTPGTITGPLTVHQGDTLTYSIGAVSNAISYQWTFPVGWIPVTGETTRIIRVIAGVSGTISVRAVGECMTSSPRSINVLSTP